MAEELKQALADAYFRRAWIEVHRSDRLCMWKDTYGIHTSLEALCGDSPRILLFVHRREEA